MDPSDDNLLLILPDEVVPSTKDHLSKSAREAGTSEQLTEHKRNEKLKQADGRTKMPKSLSAKSGLLKGNLRRKKVLQII